MKPQTGKVDIWTALEIAVRTHAERLPVDAFLDRPEDRVASLMRQRAPKPEPAPVRNEPVLLEEDRIQEILDETEIIEPPRPVSEMPLAANEAKALEEELRNQLSGKSLTELDDI